MSSRKGFLRGIVGGVGVPQQVTQKAPYRNHMPLEQRAKGSGVPRFRARDQGLVKRLSGNGR
jgi:hypothetical protein